MEALEDRRVLAAVTVSTLADIVDGNVSSIPALIAGAGADGSISLREAITAANADTAADMITFAPSLSGGEILLNHTSGQLNISDSLTIDASSLPAGITVDADDPTGGFHNNGDGIRIFNVTDPSSGTNPPLVTMTGMTLTGADPALAGSPQGGAIRSEGILTLRNMVIVENGADFGAGVYLAVAANGTAPRDVLIIENSRIEHNSAYFHGGGVFVQFSSTAGGNDTVQIDGSMLSHNVAGPREGAGDGGALYITNGADPNGAGANTNHAVIVTSSTFSTNVLPQSELEFSFAAVSITPEGGSFHESSAKPCRARLAAA